MNSNCRISSARFLFLRILRKLGLLKHLQVETEDLGGFVIPLVGEVGWANLYQAEAWLSPLLNKLALEREKCIVDVGANVGQTLLSFKGIYPGHDYVGFEPNPACVNYLYQLKERNRLRNVSIVASGLGMETGLAKLAVPKANPADTRATTVTGFASLPSHERIVPVMGEAEITSFLNQRNVGVLKIDVEGAELEVFRALRRVIEKDRPAIIIEVLPNYGGAVASRVQEQVALARDLRESGYQISRIIKTADGGLEGLRAVEDFGDHSNLEWADYCCVAK